MKNKNKIYAVNNFTNIYTQFLQTIERNKKKHSYWLEVN